MSPIISRPRFFAEFEFQGVGNRVYWLPLTIAADDTRAARDLWIRFRTAIQARYTLRAAAPPERIIQGLNSDRISEYKKLRARGRLGPLHIHEWTLRGQDAGPEFTFDEDLELAALEPGKDSPRLIAHRVERKIPVRVVSDDSRFSTEEVLFIDVVLPSSQQSDA